MSQASSTRTQLSSSDPQAADPTGSVRLMLKPSGQGRGHVDGAWWPRTDDLDQEAPSLLAAVNHLWGRPVRLNYSIDEWRTAGRSSTHAGQQVRLDGFNGRPPHLIHLTDPHHHVLTLVVVPPGSDAAVAQDTLSRSSTLGNLDTVGELLEPVRAAVFSG